MTAIDTNIIIRFITGDEPDQSSRARALLETRVCFVPDTVILETGWVLESIYGFSRSSIARALTAFLGLENVRVHSPERLHRALTWYGDALDFADALHLSTCHELERLMTFDRTFARRAAGKSPCTVTEL